MAELAELPYVPPTPPQHGFVVNAPIGTDAPLSVRLPSFDDDHVFEVIYWMNREEELPTVGDRVLVVFDDEGEPWVTAWWPG